MADFISFNENEFTNCVTGITDSAAKLKDTKLTCPDITCNSEGLASFIDVMEEVQNTITAYENFVTSDIKRIQTLVNNLKTQDQSAVIQMR